MKKISIVAAVALIAVPATVQAAEPQQTSFEYEGARYTYVVTETGSGRTIKGWEETSRTPFTLHVSKSRVSGRFGFNQVSFPRKAVKPLTGTVEVALK